MGRTFQEVIKEVDLIDFDENLSINDKIDEMGEIVKESYYNAGWFNKEESEDGR